MKILFFVEFITILWHFKLLIIKMFNVENKNQNVNLYELFHMPCLHRLDASWMHSRTGEMPLLLAHAENRFGNLRVEGRDFILESTFLRTYFNVSQRAIARERKRRRERRERKIVIANPSIENHIFA